MRYLHDAELIDFLGHQESQYIASPSEFRGRVNERIAQRGRGNIGDSLPWTKTEGKVGLLPGELTIWHGWGGHGKSLMLGEVMAWLLHKRKCLIASMEMPPEETIERLTYQCAGHPNPGPEWCRQWDTWTDDRLWIYDQLDEIPMERILGMVHYAAKELGINHIVIDSLVMCGVTGDTEHKMFEAQREFCVALSRAVKELKVHVHLVAHCRKGQDEAKVPNKHDVAGSANITNVAWNVIGVWMNKDKLEKKSIGEEVSQDECDALLSVQKNRSNGWLGKFALWFDAPSWQFVSKPGWGAMRWPGMNGEYTPGEAA